MRFTGEVAYTVRMHVTSDYASLIGSNQAGCFLVALAVWLRLKARDNQYLNKHLAGLPPVAAQLN